MSCLTCAHWQPRRSGDMARHGYGVCAAGPAWQHLAPQHTCPKHKPAAESVTQARTQWLNKLDAKASKTPAGASKQETKGKA